MVEDGFILVRNTDALMAGQDVTRNGVTVTLDRSGRGIFRADSGIHLCGPEWVVEEGEAKTQVVERDGERRIQPEPGPLMIIKGAEGHCEGQMVTARDGTVIQFNHRGYGCGPDNCGLDLVPGYRYVEPATSEAVLRYGVSAPTTLRDLERQQAAQYEPPIEEPDPYEELQRKLDEAAFRKATTGATGGTQEPAEKAGETAASEGADLTTQLMAKHRKELETIAKELGIDDADKINKFPNKGTLIVAITGAIEDAANEAAEDADSGSEEAEPDPVNDAGEGSGATVNPADAARALMNTGDTDG